MLCYVVYKILFPDLDTKVPSDVSRGSPRLLIVRNFVPTFGPFSVQSVVSVPTVEGS